MSEVHSSAEDLGGYFRGLLEASSASTVEIHCASCAACAARLRDEARLELSLHELVETRPAPRRRVQRSGARVVAALVVGLAAAAAAAVALVASRPAIVAIRKDAPAVTTTPATATAGSANGDAGTLGTPAVRSVNVAEGETLRLSVGDVTSYHLDAAAKRILTISFGGSSAFVIGNGAGEGRVVLVKRTHETLVYDVTVTAPTRAPEVLRVGDLRTFNGSDIVSFHVQNDDVVDVAGDGATMTITATSVGRTSVTFVQKNGEVRSFRFQVLAK
jgi:anti-sigma factor RsiW